MNGYTGNYIEAADLMGLELPVEVEIAEVIPAGTLKSDDGRTIDKPILKFRDRTRALVLNKTNARRIAFCNPTRRPVSNEWIGVKIKLGLESDRRPDLGGKRGPCVRVIL